MAGSPRRDGEHGPRRVHRLATAERQGAAEHRRLHPSPDAADPSRRGPAIDPIFTLTETESYFWTSTTHLETPTSLGTGMAAVYVAFGQAFGVFADAQGAETRINVHGAGAQRSDPKSGDPALWAGGRGPQSDDVRIFNHVRAVRDAR